MQRFVFAVFLVVACATGATADTFEDADSVYKRGDYALAAQLFRPLAEQGNAQAQMSLGYMYANGLSVTKNDQEALKWYRMAAEQGDPQAQIGLGYKYANGLGVTKNDQEALKWYRKAGEQGNVWAQTSLGLMYANGQGVTHNDQEAVRWYRKAAEQGDAPSQLALGVMYDKGRGISQDLTRAHMWYSVAAASLRSDSKQNAMRNRDSVASRMTAVQIAKAQEMARRCQDTKFKECE